MARERKTYAKSMQTQPKGSDPDPLSHHAAQIRPHDVILMDCEVLTVVSCKASHSIRGLEEMLPAHHHARNHCREEKGESAAQ